MRSGGAARAHTDSLGFRAVCKGLLTAPRGKKRQGTPGTVPVTQNPQGKKPETEELLVVLNCTSTLSSGSYTKASSRILAVEDLQGLRSVRPPGEDHWTFHQTSGTRWFHFTGLRSFEIISQNNKTRVLGGANRK